MGGLFINQESTLLNSSPPMSCKILDPSCMILDDIGGHGGHRDMLGPSLLSGTVTRLQRTSFRTTTAPSRSVRLFCNGVPVSSSRCSVWKPRKPTKQGRWPGGAGSGGVPRQEKWYAKQPQNQLATTKASETWMAHPGTL